jgi:ATP phosphoribosyltransferase regulatory subunit
MIALQNCETRRVEEREKVLICYKEEDFKEAYNKAVEFRKNNIVAELSLMDSEEEAAKYAKKKGINRVIKISN